MFISRSGSYIDILNWLILCSIWSIGGWLLCVHVFQLRSRERMFAGISSGLLLFILFSNILARFFEIEIAYWIASIIILIIGLCFAWQNQHKPRFPIKDFMVWEQILGFGFLLILFTLINFGLAIFDDYSNLPITSIIASGDIPPHFYLNPEELLDYHYGMHLFAASMVRIAGFFPWSALDISKSLSISMTILLSWLWFRRYIRSEWSWLWVVVLILFANGARYLLLFVSGPILERIGTNIKLLGSALHTGADLHGILTSTWVIEGDGPIPFPFAFMSGMSGPLTLAMGGNSAFPKLTLFLLLLLAQRHWKPFQSLFFGLLLASLALISEHHFAIIWAGIFLAALISGLYRKSFHHILEWASVLLPSLLLVPFISGALMTTIQEGLALLTGQTSFGGIGIPSIGFRWPPAFLSGHLGTLSLTDPGQVFIALCEMGPILFLAPLVIWVTRDYIRSGKLLMAGLSLMAIFSFLTPIFIRFTERDRDLTRLTGAALYIWLILAIPYLWFALKKGNKALRFTIAAGYMIVILSGLALLPSQLIAIASPQASYYIQEPDVLISQEYWNNLDPQAQILDLTYHYRPAVLFGRSAGRAYQTVYNPFPEFRTLINNPDPIMIAKSGYSYVYLDRQAWRALNKELKLAFQQPCVKILSERQSSMGDFRRLFDIHACGLQD